jgi:thymidylate synthase (FAD)
MRIIGPSVEILTPLEPELLVNIERAGRTCYKSESEFTTLTADKFVRMLIKRGHEAMIEHSYVTVKFICDRGVSHEIVRHRIASYAQESTRYCNYSKEKFGNEITFIDPFFFDPYHKDSNCECDSCQKRLCWEMTMHNCEVNYLELIKYGAKPEEARSVLPNSLKTEIVCTFNLREWRAFFKLRCPKTAHPQMRQLTLPLYYEFLAQVPGLVEDIIIPEESYADIPFAEVTYNLWEPKQLVEVFEVTDWIKD